MLEKLFPATVLCLILLLSGCGWNTPADTTTNVPAGIENAVLTPEARAASLSYEYPTDVDPGLVFHHPGGVASDGEHVMIADRNNNRVLVWNAFPTGDDDAPDLVLGQTDLTSTDSGDGPEEMNWPTGVTTDGTHWIVADTYNDRVLIWNEFPSQNGEAPDLILTNKGWPWAVWSDGEKLIVTSTAKREVLVWNTFPSTDRAADFTLAIPEFGTPRSIGSDGTRLVISDHNANVDGKNAPGTFFWETFPTRSNEPYDFFTASPGGDMPEILWSPIFTPTGEFVALGQRNLYVWDAFPNEQTVTVPDATIGNLAAGDASALSWDGTHLLASLDNQNVVQVYDGIPTANQAPTFSLGVTQYWITNPVPVTDGQKLYVTSDFDHTLAVWNTLPDDPSDTPPDDVYVLAYPAWDTTVWNDDVYLAGGQNVSRFADGKQELLFSKKIGSTTLRTLKGIAIDDQYFYLADADADRVYVWKGMPSSVNVDPFVTLNVNSPMRLSSDGEYLSVAVGEPGGVAVYRVADFASGSAPSPRVTINGLNGYELINLPNDALIKDGKLLIASTVANTVLIWNDVEDAIGGVDPDIIWGATEQNAAPWHGDGLLFWPGALEYDDGVIWMGEFKFSDRLLRYSI